MRLISVDLPTLGNPTRATSASSLSSRRSQRSSPSSPCSLNDSSDATLWSATSHTSPPEPPSPPSGPPLATCASRRNATEPAPPSPALACRLHSSTNWATATEYDGGAGRMRTRAGPPPGRRGDATHPLRSAAHADHAAREGTMDIDWIDDTGVVHLDHGVNAFERVFVEELHAALDVVEANESARALVTVGAHKHYSNGFDIEFLGSLDGSALASFMERALGVLARLLTFPVPTAAAVNGHAFGIGALLALAHDRRGGRPHRR